MPQIPTARRGRPGRRWRGGARARRVTRACREFWASPREACCALSCLQCWSDSWLVLPVTRGSFCCLVVTSLSFVLWVVYTLGLSRTQSCGDRLIVAIVSHVVIGNLDVNCRRHHHLEFSRRVKTCNCFHLPGCFPPCSNSSVLNHAIFNFLAQRMLSLRLFI